MIFLSQDPSSTCIVRSQFLFSTYKDMLFFSIIMFLSRQKIKKDLDDEVNNLHSTDDWEASEKSHIADSLSMAEFDLSFVILSKEVASK